ncbi:MAG: FG-GAP repeat protein, partial [Kofleriaceae bacterium]|nr:FG-GAP repeat protein [Kofleriaceae bacterium]
MDSGTASGLIVLDLGVNVISIAVNAAETYTISVNRGGAVLEQLAYGKASNTGINGQFDTNDQFGISVSLSGNTLAIGAPLEDSNAIGTDGNQNDDSALGSGAVYVFTRMGSTWTQQAYLKASNTGDNDEFGTSISLSGDTVAVGAPREDSNAKGVDGNQNDNSSSSSGAVYV